jgi:hypothetical protein
MFGPLPGNEGAFIVCLLSWVLLFNRLSGYRADGKLVVRTVYNHRPCTQGPVATHNRHALTRPRSGLRVCACGWVPERRRHPRARGGGACTRSTTCTRCW